MFFGHFKNIRSMREKKEKNSLWCSVAFVWRDMTMSCFPMRRLSFAAFLCCLWNF